ncbi:Uncharacterised protein [Mycobacteroides abscessus subsp. abscessus]|nr:Uncharacterised protein [Mycobacteroides abscessus subsp. abscessus]SII73913.1 Uncharacterised protein [Mycobacteroides abscessus subsp. abscessus]SIJ41805.1 Uncharacterised protein [Mycobacteroides abscessus subsp. abscessus]SIJ53532.1 Uncharacterised protein [Mycobacteroides abscessus subsp. abscessus]SIL51794.1 Uncharacterised protein [Mycobacteroides abscessus subsp. abscessus]
MSRRGYDRMRTCAESGCREVSITNYQYRRDWAEAMRREAGTQWRCIRHDKPEQVLSAGNPRVAYEVTSEARPYGHFWGSTGLLAGPGFKAWANDFPAGTRLIVTAQIVIPAEAHA